MVQPYQDTLCRRYNPDMSISKFAQYTNSFVIGVAGASIVVTKQHPHIDQHGPAWPDSAFRVPVVAVTTSSISTYLGTGTSSFGR